MVYNEELDKDIPVGWSFGTLGDISTQFSGFSFKGDKYSYNKGITVVRGENVSEQKLRWDTRKKWNHKLEERIKKCFLQADDLLIGMDGSKIGKNWSLVSEFELPLLLAQRVTSVRAINKIYSFFIYISFSVCDFKEYVYQVKTGTSIPHISGKQIKDFPMITPTDDIAEKFDAKTRIMFNAIFTNTQASKTLQDLQSLLLAKMTQQESKAQAV